MKGLSTLIRLQNWKVDEVRRALGALESERAEYVQESKDLEAEVKREQVLAVELNVSEQYGYFAEGVNVKREEIKHSIREVDVKIEKVRDELSELFQELKRYEIALERRLDEAEKEELRKEQQLLDETGMQMHMRKQQGRNLG